MGERLAQKTQRAGEQAEPAAASADQAVASPAPIGGLMAGRVDGDGPGTSALRRMAAPLSEGPHQHAPGCGHGELRRSMAPAAEAHQHAPGCGHGELRRSLAPESQSHQHGPGCGHDDAAGPEG